MVVEVGVAVSFAAAGLVACRVRPRLGALMITVGGLWAVARFPLPVPGGGQLATALLGGWAAALVHLVLAYPTGRLDRTLSRLVAGAAYLSAASVGLLAAGSGPLPAGGELPPPVRAAGTAGAVLIGLAVIALNRARWSGSSHTRRRYLAPVLPVATIVAATAVLLKPTMIAGVAVPYLAPVMQLALTAVPLAYLVSLLRQRMDQARVAQLVVALDGGAGPAGMQQVLARTLHDPQLRVGYWQPEPGRYVDRDGHPVTAVEAGTAGGQPVATPVHRDGAPLAVLVHDPELREHPELMAVARAAVALTLDNERLHADLRARQRQLGESRRQTRAVAALRRRWERDLHDGVQQRLLSIPMTLSLAESALHTGPDRALPLIREAKHATLAAVAELRDLAQGLHPPVLTERGLAGAVQELAALTPLPVRVCCQLGAGRAAQSAQADAGLPAEVDAGLPAEVEAAAYYLVAEALANVTKHAQARHARVTLTRQDSALRVEVGDDGRGGANPARGTGLRGLADRAAAAGGVLRIDSPPGRGTRIRAVLPCA